MTTVVRGANGLWGWSREHWDPSRQLVANPAGGYAELGPFAGKYLIRETAWFALDALGHGEVNIAAQALRSVLSRQYDRPGRPWHGTFPIFDHDTEPGDDAIMWLSYDPNWRQFIGVTLAIIVDGYSDVLPASLVRACETAVVRAVEGEPAGRIPPEYSNPALMHAWLADWAGRRLGLTAHQAEGWALAEQVTRLFDASGCLYEFNSPTYDGVNLFAATLWATAGEPLRGPGRRIASALLDAMGFLYHPGLHNLCGPFTRAYGMDLSSRITLYGLWRLVACSDPAALPPISGEVEHSHDLFFAPLAEWANRHSWLSFPPDNGRLPRRRTFSLPGGRRATAFLAPDFMVGAEAGGRHGLVWDQYVPGSVHWAAGGGVSWLRVHAAPGNPVDCSLIDTTLAVHPGAAAGSVTFTTTGTVERLGASRLRLGSRVTVQGAGDLSVRPLGTISCVSGRGPFEVSVD